MKIIDLLNKIANGEEMPKLIGYENNIYCWTGGNYYDEKHYDFLDNHICIVDLIYEVEIIEEEKKIPEKIDIRQEKNCKNNWKWKVYGEEHSYNISTPQKLIADKVNEILDYLQSKGE